MFIGFRRTYLVLLLLIPLLIATGCSTPPTTTTQSSSSAPADPNATMDAETETDAENSTDEEASEALIPVTVAFPYIPNVQFAPYYVAAEKGYYREAGLDVTFEHMFEDEAVQLMAQGKAQFGFISGISVLLARQNGIPLVTVATITQKFPVVFFSKASHTLASVQDLRGKKIGIPGRFGASYYGLLAVLYASDMTEADLDIHDIGFAQMQMISEDKVDVAIGYAVNEPVQLRQLGEDVSILSVDDIYPLVSDGIITTEDVINGQPDVVEKFVQATLQGVQDSIAMPDEAFDLCLKHIPEAEGGDVELQRAILDETIRYWQGDTEKLGYNDPQLWEQTQQFLLDNGLLTKAMLLDEAYRNDFVE